MKIILKIIVITFVLSSFHNCSIKNKQETIYYGNFIEYDYPFLNSIIHIEDNETYLEKLLDEKYFGNPYRNITNYFRWIRNPLNLEMLNNTIQSIGYQKFISKKEYNKKIDSPNTSKDWKGYSLNQIVKKLIVSFKEKDFGDEPYFKKFWKRRIAENNHKITYKILNDISNDYNEQKIRLTEKKIINDTIATLLKFDLELQNNLGKPDKIFLLEYFDYLKQIKLRHSAYNLVIEIYPSNEIEMDSIIKTLNLKRIEEQEYWETRNNAIWIKSHKDNGP